jgi:hypothetical protein
MKIYILLLSVLLLASCRDAKYHFDKFISKGGKLDSVPKTVTVTDTIIINGQEVIRTVEVPIDCPELIVPKSEKEIRYEYLLDRKRIQSLEAMHKRGMKTLGDMYADSLYQARKIIQSNNRKEAKVQVQQQKTERKKSNNLFWIGFATCGGLISICFFLKFLHKTKSRLNI